ITIEILPRIHPNDSGFGKTYTQRFKNIGTYFRKEFKRLRVQIEKSKYWHNTILENYRYKGDGLYKAIKKDLLVQRDAYSSLLEHIQPKGNIAHISKSYGQLDLLLALDSIDRKITVYLEAAEARKMLKNNFLTQQYSNISIVDTAVEALRIETQTLLIDAAFVDDAFFKEQLNDEITELFILKDGTKIDLGQMTPSGFAIGEQNDNFILLKKIGEEVGENS
ncbi:MAG: hypothetical protein HKN31_09300, partial [Pricia sp.]|nr:hypothetical protein [Pricia sp.]